MRSAAAPEASDNDIGQRVRRARRVVERVAEDREAFVTAYGKATTAVERFGIVAAELRMEAARKVHQPDPELMEAEEADGDPTTRRIELITDVMRELLEELFDAREQQATKVVRTDARQRERNERRRGDGGPGSRRGEDRVGEFGGAGDAAT